MRALRRLLQAFALVGTLCVGILALALIVSQTPWFRDWLRRYIVRESKQYLNGELAIGGLNGNLFFGVNLSDVAVDVSGERVISVKGLNVDYSIIDFITEGIVIDEIRISNPVVIVERDGRGWNLGRLVKKQEQEADRRGPRRPISLGSIVIEDASVSILDERAPSGYRLPRRLEELDIKAGFEYAPVHYTVTLDSASFRGAAPELDLHQLSGTIAVREDNLYLDTLVMRTAESSVTVDGVVEHYLRTPTVKLTTTGNVSLPEIGRVVPAAAGYGLHPIVDITANGPAKNLDLVLDVRSEAGNVRGRLTADVQAPDLAFKGEVDTERLDLAPILKDPAQRSTITGHGTIDLEIASHPARARFMDRISGTFRFAGPHVAAAGYEARNVRATGRLDDGRITLDARADAYGGTGTARGSIVTPAPGRALAYDLRGSATSVDLRDLPASTGAPRLATDLSVAQYHVRGAGRSVTGSATLNRSTVEGATIGDGTVATFDVTPRSVSYTAKGQTADLNLQRIGAALNVAALAKPDYDSRINGTFDVSGTLDRTAARGRLARGTSTLDTMTIDARGTVTDSTLWGGRLPRLGFEARVDRGAFEVRADGQFEDFDPARLTGRKNLAGRVTGTVDARVAIADLDGPIGPEDVTADGTLTLDASVVGGLTIDAADVEGTYAAQVGDIARLKVTGPDVIVDASGRLALDRATQSNLTYHVDAIDLAGLAALAGRPGVSGSAVLDGTLTGNAAELTTKGTVNGSNLAYEKNSALDLNSAYTVTVPDLRPADARVQATTTATFVAAGGFEIAELTATTTYRQQRLDFTTNIKEKRRTLDATGQLILHPDHSEVHVPRLSLKTQGIEWQSAPGAEAVVRYGRGRIELSNIRLVSAGQSLNADGALALKSGEAAAAGTIRVQARNVDLQQLETLLLQDRGFTGRLNADATIAGSTTDPAVDGHVEVKGGGFRTYTYESLVADVKYAGPRLQLDARLQQSPTEFVTARGSVPRTLFEKGEARHVAPAGEDQIDLQITSSQVDLGLVQGLTDQVTEVTGTLQADVHVSGSGRDPHLNGFVNIQNGAFTIPLGGTSYTGLNTRIDLRPDRAELTSFTILDEHGKPMTISGNLAVHERQVGAVNVTVHARDFELIDNQLGDVGVDADLRITGELRRPRIEGDVRLEDARVEVHQILQLFYDPYAVEAMPDVVSAERIAESAGSAKEATDEALRRAETSAAAPGEAARAATEAPPAPAGAFAPVELDIRLRIPDNLVLRGRDLRPGGPTGTALGDMNITVGGDLQVRKSNGGQMVLVGNVQTVRGYYEFQGRRFNLQRGGLVRFVGTPQINPALDVTATRRIPNTGVEARVRITGTARAPELALSSNPPLEESDILSLIVFNRPVNELGTGERSSLAATAGGIATGFLAAPLGESLGRALDLDLFEITTSGEEGDLQAGVTLGQQVGDRAFFKLRQQFGERATSEFLIEYQLSDFLRLQATAAPETSGSGNRLTQRRIERAGIDLIFFFSY